MIARATGRLAGAQRTALRWYRWDVAEARGGVLLVHGFGDHAGRFSDVVRVLGARGYSVLAYDARGHGASEGPRGHADRFDLFLADLDALWMEAERSLRGRRFLYGHSFGGLTVLRWLQTRPHRPAGVVLSAPWLATRLRVPAGKRLIARVLLRVAPALAIPNGANVPEYLTRDRERVAAYLRIRSSTIGSRPASTRKRPRPSMLRGRPLSPPRSPSCSWSRARTHWWTRGPRWSGPGNSGAGWTSACAREGATSCTTS